jgi:hypothetical protein
MSFLSRGGLPLRWQEDMMFKVETSTLEERLAADLGRDAGLRAVERRAGIAGHRPAGAVGDGTIQPVLKTGQRGAL